jgi:phage terminase small subunit
MSLTTKQQRFVAEYLIDLNATQAAIRAGYSAKSARVVGCRSITKANIAAAIEKARTKRAERTELTQDWVVDELRKIAGANMLDYMKSTPAGDPYLDFSALNRDQGSVLAEVTVEDFVDGRGEGVRAVKRVKFKLHDKLGALDKLGRHLGLFDAKHKRPDAPVEVTVEELRATVYRALARLHESRRAASDRRGNEPPTIDGTSTRVDPLGAGGAAPAAG